MPVEVISNTEAIKERHRAALSDAIGECGEVFLSFTRARFAREGDGWADLAGVTNEDREELGFPPEHPILKRLGILEGALTQGNDGNLFEHSETSVVVGISGGSHPGYETDSGSAVYANSIEAIALKHQHGIGIPARPIFVMPDDGTLDQMQSIILERTTLAVG